MNSPDPDAAPFPGGTRRTSTTNSRLYLTRVGRVSTWAILVLLSVVAFATPESRRNSVKIGIAEPTGPRESGTGICRQPRSDFPDFSVEQLPTRRVRQVEFLHPASQTDALTGARRLKKSEPIRTGALIGIGEELERIPAPRLVAPRGDPTRPLHFAPAQHSPTSVCTE